MDLALSSGDDSTIPEDSASDEDSELEVFPLDEDDSDKDSSEEKIDGSSNEENLADSSTRAWGSKKSHFYDANEESSSGDELEEGEAKTLQHRMQSTLQEDDFIAHWFQDDLKPMSSTLDPVPDMSRVPQSKECLVEMLTSFDSHFKWLLELGLPAVRSCGKNLSLSPQGYKYLYCKVHLLFCYCINVLHYLHHEMHCNKVALHTNRVSELSELLLQISDIDEVLEEVIQEPQPVSTIDHQDTAVPRPVVNKIPSTGQLSDEARQFYETVKQKKLKKKQRQSESYSDPIMDDVDEDGKRAITFEMARNKGLTPSRKKEQRNPRVKHRNKYRRALIKRKSQVLPVVPELTKYGGEGSGIRSRLARSVALK